MVVIRLARTGSKKNPFYHVVVADKRSPRDGRYIERVGYFNPNARGQAVRLKLEGDRIEHWLGKGAQASDTVRTLISQSKNAANDTPAPTFNEYKKSQLEQAAIAQKKKLEEEKKAAAQAAKAETAPAEETKEENAE